MYNTDPIATGTVSTLAINGKPVQEILFELSGPVGDNHSGFKRRLSGHDGTYIKTSNLMKGAQVFNWRSWTGLSTQELNEIEHALGLGVPVGCLFENITISGIPNFSKLEPGTRLVFPRQVEGDNFVTQAILAVWEENGPCRTVGERLENYHGLEGLKTLFIREAQNRRGVMGFVLSAGKISRNDQVLVYPPVR
jgi:hypothetical protein